MRFARLRQSPRAARLAAVLWIVWSVLLWNVVFDHVIVVAGREYIMAANRAAIGAGPYARVEDWMRPAINRGVIAATIAAGAVLLFGLVAVRLAAARSRASSPQQVSL